MFPSSWRWPHQGEWPQRWSLPPRCTVAAGCGRSKVDHGGWGTKASPLGLASILPGLRFYGTGNHLDSFGRSNQFCMKCTAWRGKHDNSATTQLQHVEMPAWCVSWRASCYLTCSHSHISHFNSIRKIQIWQCLTKILNDTYRICETRTSSATTK